MVPIDKHLNLFFSYNQGQINDIEKEKQLENNLTRALIVTISNLEYILQLKFIQSLIEPDKLKSKSFQFDLQNTTYNRNQNSSKYVLIIQRDKNIITLDGLLDNVHSSRIGNIPDAWIIGANETILIETKIGDNPASKSQIFRHITGKNGYNIPRKLLRNSNLRIINKSWEDICIIIKNLKATKEQDRFLLSQLHNYIIMTAQILSLQYIIDNKIILKTHKQQFKLFLNKLSNEIENERLPFFSENRNKSGLWEGYGIKKSDKVNRNPHYTIGFSDEAIVIYLTTTKLNQISKSFFDQLTDFIKENKDAKENFRYNICQNQYKLVDYKKGQIRGEFQSPFKLNIKFSEFKDKNIQQIIDVLLTFNELKIYKQFELGYSIQFYDFSKTEDSQFYEFSNTDENQKSLVRDLNKDYLLNPDKIIRSFVDFIKKTKHLFYELQK